MSTRCTVLVKTVDDEILQYFRHGDGYPEYMGKFLVALGMISWRANFSNIDIEKIFELEGDFKKEEYKTIHPDVEYIWMFDDNSCEISFVSVVPFDDEDRIKKIVESFEEDGCCGNQVELALNVK